MIRWFCIVLLAVAAAFAETQQEAYYRAMKAEEAGDITAALKAFKEAAALTGPYTEEIQDIIRDYNAALGISEDDSASQASSWEFHVAGELGLYGLHYKQTGMDEGEMGGDLYLNVNPYLDYASGAWLHTFGASVQGDYFLNNDNMMVLDTNDWNLSLGLEYSLMGPSLLLGVGYDFNIEGDDYSSDFYVMFTKDFYRNDNQRLSASAFAFYQTSGQMSGFLNAIWNQTFIGALKGFFCLGAKFEADSVLDTKAYLKSIMTATTEDEIVFRMTLGKWFGPIFRTKLYYKFKNKIAVEGFLRMFYGFTMDGPDEDYKKIKKFNAIYGGEVSWKYWKIKYYLGLERNYKHYSLPRFYKSLTRERSALTRLKLGAKWDI